MVTIQRRTRLKAAADASEPKAGDTLRSGMRRYARWGIAGVCALVALRVITFGIADSLSDSHPRAALLLDSGNVAALLDLSRRELAAATAPLPQEESLDASADAQAAGGAAKSADVAAGGAGDPARAELRGGVTTGLAGDEEGGSDLRGTDLRGSDLRRSDADGAGTAGAAAGDAGASGAGPGPATVRAGDEAPGAEHLAELGRAAANAARALALSPVNPEALTILARVAEQEGDGEKAKEIFAQAGRLTRRSVEVQAWRLQGLVAQGDLAGALLVADGMLRLSGETFAILKPFFAALVEDPEARPILTDYLKKAPPWRRMVLGEAIQSSSSPALVQEILTELARGPTPPGADDWGRYLRRLIVLGRTDEAYATWISQLPFAQLAEIPSVYNGSFEQDPSGSPFDWTIDGGPTATARLVDRPDGKGRAVLLDFVGGRASLGVWQMLFLAPGRYQLTAQGQADELTSDRGLAWRIYCADGQSRVPLGQTDPVNGTSSSWVAMTSRFEVPRTRCRAQWLRLEPAANYALGQEISGAAIFDDVIIVRDPS